jgi:hypothetical protein
MSGGPATPKFRPIMCKKVVEMMKQGASITEVLLELDICWQTYCNWTNPESKWYQDDFHEAIQKGKRFSQGWWERLGRRVMSPDADSQYRNPNPTMFIFNMKNRFKEDWQEVTTQKNTGANGGPIEYTLREIVQEIDGSDTGIGPSKSRRPKDNH